MTILTNDKWQNNNNDKLQRGQKWHQTCKMTSVDKKLKTDAKKRENFYGN